MTDAVHDHHLYGRRMRGLPAIVAFAALALTAGAGSYPRDLTVNAPGGQYVVIGLRLQARSHTRFVPSPVTAVTRPSPLSSTA